MSKSDPAEKYIGIRTNQSTYKALKDSAKKQKRSMCRHAEMLLQGALALEKQA